MRRAFLDQLVDWRDFEAFVHELYARHADLVVEHNVTVVGKSGATRQIDVRFTHRAAGHTYVTLVECKRWKQRVSRDRIDVLAASMNDLNAAKGVMFTTVGYETGAETYARDKGIDLFVVRDLTDEEWGKPGRMVGFWIEYYGAEMSNISSGRVRFLGVPGAPPSLNLDLKIGKVVSPNPEARLYSIDDGVGGPNLLDLLLEARKRVLTIVSREFAVRTERTDGAVTGHLVPVRLDLTSYPYRDLRQRFGNGRLEGVSMDLLVTISQSLFQHDRAAHLDLALAVENFMTRQRQVVTRGGGSPGVTVFDVVDRAGGNAPDDVLQNGAVFRVLLEPWVKPPALQHVPKRTKPVTFTLPNWDLAVSEDPRPPVLNPDADRDADTPTSS